MYYHPNPAWPEPKFSMRFELSFRARAREGRRPVRRTPPQVHRILWEHSRNRTSLPSRAYGFRLPHGMTGVVSTNITDSTTFVISAWKPGSSAMDGAFSARVAIHPTAPNPGCCFYSKERRHSRRSGNPVTNTSLLSRRHPWPWIPFPTSME
uniref:Uncharacterized protein n=1 Tax=Candidatus Kentrum sp. UNK TaxID=2126344 RepID=A0A451AX70_9GAMM|nr:MAG: hypothetical protein BECKUNK1418H_GA0071006_103225 [Candidatus Kentron sp. UNK]